MNPSLHEHNLFARRKLYNEKKHTTTHTEKMNKLKEQHAKNNSSVRA